MLYNLLEPCVYSVGPSRNVRHALCLEQELRDIYADLA